MYTKLSERFEKLGVNFIKKPDDGKMKGLAFYTDPDGYWIEILQANMIEKIRVNVSKRNKIDIYLYYLAC